MFVAMPYTRVIDDRWTFRDADTKEYTHGYHIYPAMMVPQIARALMDEYGPEGEFKTVLDPYMGSGTTLVEASIRGVNSIGSDLNPLARMMSKVKTTHYEEDVIKKQFTEISFHLSFYDAGKVRNRNFERVSNSSYWYSEEVLLKLSYIHQLIEEYAANSGFFRLILAEIIREVSYTRNGEFKRFRMSKDKIANYNPNPFELFEKKVKRNIAGLHAYNKVTHNTDVTICDFNSTHGIPNDIIAVESIDMVVTSPPYGDSRTTVAYGQFSRWANEWFGFDNAKTLDRELMGGGTCREVKFNSTELNGILSEIRMLDEKRYWEVVAFLNDYSSSIQNVSNTVRVGGRVCYVVGDRRVKGIQIPLDYFTAEVFEQCGFVHIRTIVREIPNKRMPSLTSPTNKSGSHVQTMSHEYIVILEKVR